MNNLDSIMKPRAIAVIGASTRAHTIGSDIMKRLQEYGFTGAIYPVNPKGGVIEGLQAYTSILDVPGEVDLAIIVVNAKFVLSTIDQCHQKGVGGLCVISAGFKETGKEGAELEKALLEKVRAYGMRCVGPNCLGVVNTHPSIRMDGCFAESLPQRGGIGFVSQSGALGGGILNILKDLNLGFAQFISIGNQADVNAETAMQYWENEDDVKQILLYMESIQNPANFRELATRISKKKPILALKAGRSAAGASAASSHTGSLAGADKAANALLRQSGVIREYSLENLFATAKVFDNCPIPKGDRVAIITNSGGPGIMATDAVSEYGMKMAQLSEETKEKLRSFLPAAASVKNPVDMIASAPIEHYKQTLETVLADEAVNMVVGLYRPFLGLKDIAVANAVMEIKAKHPEKPIVGVFMTTSEFFAKLSDMQVNVPFFMYAEQAVDGLNRLNEQRLWIEKPMGKVVNFTVNRERARDFLHEFNVLNYNEALGLASRVLQKAAQWDVFVTRDTLSLSDEGTVDVVLFSKKGFDATKLDPKVTEFGSAWSDEEDELNRKLGFTQEILDILNDKPKNPDVDDSDAVEPSHEDISIPDLYDAKEPENKSNDSINNKENEVTQEKSKIIDKIVSESESDSDPSDH